MQHGDKSHDDMTIEYRFRRHTIWFSMFMFAKDRVRVKKNRVSSFNNFFRDCASIGGWNAKTCLISCRTRGEAVQSSKKLSHLENIGKSRYTISKPILCRCITQNAELDLEHNAPHLFENANDIILQSMHWIVMGALFSADKKIGCCF